MRFPQRLFPFGLLGSSTLAEPTPKSQRVDLYSLPECAWDGCFPYHASSIGCTTLTTACFCDAPAPLLCAEEDCSGKLWADVEGWYADACGSPWNAEGDGDDTFEHPAHNATGWNALRHGQKNAIILSILLGFFFVILPMMGVCLYCCSERPCRARARKTRMRAQRQAQGQTLATQPADAGQNFPLADLPPVYTRGGISPSWSKTRG